MNKEKMKDIKEYSLKTQIRFTPMWFYLLFFVALTATITFLSLHMNIANIDNNDYAVEQIKNSKVDGFVVVSEYNDDYMSYKAYENIKDLGASFTPISNIGLYYDGFLAQHNYQDVSSVKPVVKLIQIDNTLADNEIVLTDFTAFDFANKKLLPKTSDYNYVGSKLTYDGVELTISKMINTGFTFKKDELTDNVNLQRLRDTAYTNEATFLELLAQYNIDQPININGQKINFSRSYSVGDNEIKISASAVKKIFNSDKPEDFVGKEVELKFDNNSDSIPAKFTIKDIDDSSKDVIYFSLNTINTIAAANYDFLPKDNAYSAYYVYDFNDSDLNNIVEKIYSSGFVTQFEGSASIMNLINNGPKNANLMNAIAIYLVVFTGFLTLVMLVSAAETFKNFYGNKELLKNYVMYSILPVLCLFIISALISFAILNPVQNAYANSFYDTIKSQHVLELFNMGTFGLSIVINFVVCVAVSVITYLLLLLSKHKENVSQETK